MSWGKVNLGDLATFVNGYPFKPSDWSDEGMEIIRIQNLTKGSAETNYYKGQIPEKYKIKNGDILISWSATLDIFVWAGKDAWLNQHIFKVVFDKKEIDRNFFVYLIKFILDDMRKEVHGATMQHITKGKFDALQVPLPPLPIQKRIAEILDAADDLRRKDQELLRKYDELAQAIFIDMFGDPVKNEKGWEVKKLGDLFSCPVKCGPFGSALKKEEYIRGGVPVWVMDNIQNYDFNENGCLFITESKYEELKSYSAKNGDIIISRAGTVGKMSVVNSNYVKSIISTNLIKISLDESQISPFYFVKLMEYFGKKIGRLRTGSDNGFTHMNTGVLSGLTFPLPPIDYQLSFLEAHANIQKQSKALNTMPEQLFGSLLQQAFKGELVK